MLIFRRLRDVSHSAILVPAATLCLGLLGWARGVDVVEPDTIALRFMHDGRSRTAAIIVPVGPPAAAAGGTSATSLTGGPIVVRDVVHGHGHGWFWPGADPLPAHLIGPRRNALNATETMWSFFVAHARH
jgi:hypothetical protein